MILTKKATVQAENQCMGLRKLQMTHSLDYYEIRRHKLCNGHEVYLISDYFLDLDLSQNVRSQV